MEGKSHGLPKLQKAQLKARSWTHAWISTTRNWGKMLEPKKKSRLKTASLYEPVSTLVLQLRCLLWHCAIPCNVSFHVKISCRFPYRLAKGYAFKLGRLFSWVPGRVWRNKKSPRKPKYSGLQPPSEDPPGPKLKLKKVVKHEDAQTNSAKCLGDNMAKWKIEKQQQQHDNVTPCVVPRTKYTCVTLSGMGKHVAQRCTSPPGKCGKLLLAFFRKTHLAKT